MKKIKKINRGFTLVEMITTITILGVVSLIALPVISNVSSGFTVKKFENYEASLLAAGKLYVDQNYDDLFGYSDDGCVNISYSELKTKNLIDDIEVEDASCNDPSTYVRAKKNNDSYDYDISIKCTLKDRVVYEKTIADDNTCEPIGPPAEDGPSGYIPISTNITSDPTKLDIPEKSKNVSILVSDEKGFAPNAKIRYWWVKAEDETAVVGSKKNYDFKNALVRSSHTLRYEISTPSGYTGDLLLKVEPVNVITGDGRKVTGIYTSEIFKIDNTAPTIKIKASYYDNNTVGNFVKEVNNADLVISDWQNHGYYFDFTGTTDNYSGFDYTQTWKWNKSGNAELVENYEGGSESNNAITNKTFTGRGARYGTVTICDKAGNCASKNVKVNISTIYTINYDGNGADSGSVNSTTCYYGLDCKLPNSGFSKTGHSFDKWIINGNEYNQGDNVKYLNKSNNGSVTAKVKWKKNKYTVTYYVNDGVGYNQNYDYRSVEYGASVPTDPNPQWTINEFKKFNGWNDVPGSMPAKDITVSANISNYMCMIITGHCPKDHVASFIPKLDASGWGGSYLEQLDNGYWRVDTPMNKNFWEAVNHFNYLWNNTGTTGYYLVYGQIYCENGSSRVRCRGWAPCQSTV